MGAATSGQRRLGFTSAGASFDRRTSGKHHDHRGMILGYIKHKIRAGFQARITHVEDVTASKVLGSRDKYRI